MLIKKNHKKFLLEKKIDQKFLKEKIWKKNPEKTFFIKIFFGKQKDLER